MEPEIYEAHTMCPVLVEELLYNRSYLVRWVHLIVNSLVSVHKIIFLTILPSFVKI